MKIAIQRFELNKLTPLPQLLTQNILNLGPSRTRGQNCLFMSKSVITMKNQASATGLFTKGQNFVADGQTSKMPST